MYDEFNLDDKYLRCPELAEEWREQYEKYIDRIDANARRLRKDKISERISQHAIKDMIESKGFSVKMEVAPIADSLRRMDLYGQVAPGREFVIEVKMGFDDFVGGVGQLNYYCHLLTKANRKPTELILAFHEEEAQKVPFDVFNYCDEQEIVAIKAEEVADHLIYLKKLVAKEQSKG